MVQFFMMHGLELGEVDREQLLFLKSLKGAGVRLSTCSIRNLDAALTMLL